MLARLWRAVRHTWCCVVYGPSLLNVRYREERRDGRLVALVCAFCGYRYEAEPPTP